MTDSRLLAEARIIARSRVNAMSVHLGFGRINVYETNEELDVGQEMLRRRILEARVGLEKAMGSNDD